MELNGSRKLEWILEFYRPLHILKKYVSNCILKLPYSDSDMQDNMFRILDTLYPWTTLKIKHKDWQSNLKNDLLKES